MTPGYVNHYFANGGLIVPAFGIPEDRKAIATLRTLHPDREVVGVYAAYLEIGGGSVHCITQQRPVGTETVHDLPSASTVMAMDDIRGGAVPSYQRKQDHDVLERPKPSRAYDHDM